MNSVQKVNETLKVNRREYFLFTHFFFLFHRTFFYLLIKYISLYTFLSFTLISTRNVFVMNSMKSIKYFRLHKNWNNEIWWDCLGGSTRYEQSNMSCRTFHDNLCSKKIRCFCHTLTILIFFFPINKTER